MTAPHATDLDHRLRAAIAPAAGVDDVQRALAVALCRDVVAMVPELGLPHRGRTTRDAVHLLVGTALPALAEATLGDLARACEVAVVRA